MCRYELDPMRPSDIRRKGTHTGRRHDQSSGTMAEGFRKVDGRFIHMTRRPTTKLRREAEKLQREAEVSRQIADYLTRTGFHSLGDVLAFYAGSAAPPRSEGMIELRKVETATSTVNPDAGFDKKRKTT